ncbi:hypothetical protein KDD17_07055 [Sulfitobacter albidus]|uniref:Uncharacterized protein n=1 Tax=Sulfitobacter albidus TaxID=2829501 RepID=A0A975PNU9_9RHOB|nr:hypothetical protein [Sulfitobacter albidus]QUJ77705.1 hypothetical protein KDD17_07055 [Sulfitobacter albidus]
MIFTAALREIAHHRPSAVRLLCIPLIVTIVVELLYTLSPHRDPQSDNIGLSILSGVVAYGAVGWIAVGWHRLRLMGEHAGLLPRAPLRVLMRYVIEWLILGILIALILLAVGGAAYLVVMALAPDPLTEQVIYGLWTDTILGPVSILPITAFTWLLFRFGISLPHLAIEGDARLGMRQAWRRTRPLAWTIFRAGLFAGIVQWAVGVLPLQLVYGSDLFTTPEGEIILAGEIVFALAYAFVYTGIPLVGAAILTVIYARTDA